MSVMGRILSDGGYARRTLYASPVCSKIQKHFMIIISLSIQSYVRGVDVCVDRVLTILLT